MLNYFIGHYYAGPNLTPAPFTPALITPEASFDFAPIRPANKVKTRENCCLSPKTVNSHRYKIFEKLQIKNDVDLTLLAIKHDILVAEEVI